MKDHVLGFGRISKKPHDHVMGIGPITICPRKGLAIEIKSDVAFFPQQLVIPSYLSSWFEIVSLEVSGQRLLNSGGHVPAVTFMEGNTILMRPVLCRIDGLVVLTVMCRREHDTLFEACIIGPELPRID